MRKIRSGTRARWRLLLWLICLVTSPFAMTAQTADSNSKALIGTVVNEKGEPLQGVSVNAQNTTADEKYSTTTNEKGVFIFLKLKPGSSYDLSCTYIGYEKNTVHSVLIREGNNSLLIKLIPSNNPMDQVVIIGYGAQKREMVTGSVATVRAEDFNQGVISDPLTLISGKVAGLAVSRPNGSDPNSSADFQLRGAVSVEGNSQPLIVIDGVPMPDNVGISNIAPADIASIDILRDGSSAAIYGSRASAGVIIITTKKGTAGLTKVTYNGYTSTEVIAKKYKLLTGDQYRALAAQQSSDPHDGGANTDWFKAMTRTPFNQGHNLNFNGGGGKTTFNAALNYQRYQGVDLVTKREFINGNLQLNSKALNDKLDITVLLANSYENKYFADYYGFGQSLVENPTYPIFDSTGSYYETPNIAYGAFWNPIANTRYNTNNNKEKRLLSTVRLSYPFFPGLRGTVAYSLNKIDVLSGSYTNSNLIYMQTSGLNGTASRNQANITDNVFEGTLEYSKRTGEHSFNIIAGYSYFDDYQESFGAGNNNFGSNAFLYNNLGAGTALNDMSGANRGGAYVSSYAQEWTLLSFFGRVIYSFGDRYLLNASIRREGGSKLGSGNKWGSFPSVSAGWILSKENFMKDLSAISFLKFRVGYGVTGNQASLQPYQSLAILGPWPYASNYGYVGSPGNMSWVQSYGPLINANPLLKWEIKKEINIGADFTLFKGGWLSGTLDLYSRRINDLIGNYNAQVPSQIWPLIYANAGNMTNKGIELSLSPTFIKRKDLRWNTTFIGAYNKNKVTSVTSAQFSGTAHDITQINGYGTEVQRIAPGQPVDVFYGPVFAGFSDAGKWLYKNAEGKPVLSEDLQPLTDYRYLGNSIPTWNLALTNSFTVGAFDLSFMLRSALGFKVLNAKRIYHENVSNLASMNLFESVLHSPLKDASAFSSYYLENGAYLKLDNLNIGYSIPLRNNTIHRLRLSVTATNLVTWTSFSGLDPELGLSPFNNTGVELNDHYYPRTRSLTFGVTADF